MMETELIENPVPEPLPDIFAFIVMDNKGNIYKVVGKTSDRDDTYIWEPVDNGH